MKTADLIGPALDWAVAKCEKPGITGIAPDGFLRAMPTKPFGDPTIYRPSTDWAQGGPIIERQEIELIKWGIDGWAAKDTNYQFLNTPRENCTFCTEYGPTPLIAVMRCYVASKLGDEVEIPEELK